MVIQTETRTPSVQELDSIVNSPGQQPEQTRSHMNFPGILQPKNRLKKLPILLVAGALMFPPTSGLAFMGLVAYGGVKLFKAMQNKHQQQTMQMPQNTHPLRDQQPANEVRSADPSENLSPHQNPLAYNMAAQQAQNSNKRGRLRTGMAKMAQAYRERFTLQGQLAKASRLNQIAAITNQYFDQQTNKAERQAHASIQSYVDGLNDLFKPDDQKAFITVMEGLNRYNESQLKTNQKPVNLSEFLMQAHKDPNIVNAFDLPEQVMEQVKTTADNLATNQRGIEVARMKALGPIRQQQSKNYQRIGAKVQAARSRENREKIGLSLQEPKRQDRNTLVNVLTPEKIVDRTH